MMEENPAPNLPYDTYAKFIIALVEAELITINLLNEQFVSIFNEEWPQVTGQTGPKNYPVLNFCASHSPTGYTGSDFDGY